MIEIKNLNFSYDNEVVFNQLNLSIKKGEFVAIIGHNGSGKSTLAKLLVGLEASAGGEISVAGIRLHDDSIDDIRKNVSIVFQNPENQFVGATVADDIAFGLENRQVPREEMTLLVSKYVEEMGLVGLEDVAPHDLSGGQKQRTAIAGALAVGAEVLILDEATSMLDPAGRTDIMKLVRELAQDEERTIIMITHHLDEAVYADKVIVFNEGQVIKSGSPFRVFTNDLEILEAVGLDVPFATRASKHLYQQSIIKKICLTNEELIRELCL